MFAWAIAQKSRCMRAGADVRLARLRDATDGTNTLSQLDVSTVKTALEGGGIEVYRSGADEIQIAERVRLHIMDSGVRVFVRDGVMHVRFTARSQRSDFPNAAAEDLFERVRSKVGTPAGERGYVEQNICVQEVLDPMDESRVLDVWHEIVYEKAAAAVDELVDEVRWALEVEKYVAS